MRDDRKNIVVEKSIGFSLLVMRYCEKLEERKRFVIARQLLRSATAIGANIVEAQNAESKRDFIHKMKIAAKEASETEYWLILCERSSEYPQDTELRIQLNQIMRLLSSIISTAKKNLGFINT